MFSGEFFNWVNSLSYFPKRLIEVEFQPPFPSLAPVNYFLGRFRSKLVKRPGTHTGTHTGTGRYTVWDTQQHGSTRLGTRNGLAHHRYHRLGSPDAGQVAYVLRDIRPEHTPAARLPSYPMRIRTFQPIT